MPGKTGGQKSTANLKTHVLRQTVLSELTLGSGGKAEAKLSIFQNRQRQEGMPSPTEVTDRFNGI